MTTHCMSSSAVECKRPIRASYVSLYKWPESDAEFVRSVGVENNKNINNKHFRREAGIVDSYSCRQMYLRSYTFTRKESVPEKTMKCLGKVKEKVRSKVEEDGRWWRRRKSCTGAKCSALLVMFRRLLMCGGSVDVDDDCRRIRVG